MTREPDKRNLQKTQWVDSLLDALYENDRERAQDLVTAGLDRIDGENTTRPYSEKLVRHPVAWQMKRWLVIGLSSAAALMLLVFFLQINTPNQAMAAVNRSIEQALANDIGRYYVVTSVIQVDEDKTMARNSALYVKGGERFALRTDGPLKVRSIWLGGDRGNAWVVPPVGPVITGDTDNLGAWVARRKEITSPYLHITTILERMRDSYELKAQPNETLLIGARSVECQHIVGDLKGARSGQGPDRISLWVSAKTGVAQKVMAKWVLADGELGRKSVLIEFKSDMNLADDFFTPEKHGGSNRPRIRFGSTGSAR